MPPIVPVLVVAAFGAFVWWKNKQPKTKSTTTSGGCVVDFSDPQALKHQLVENQAVVSWEMRLVSHPEQSAQQAAVDLMKILAPQCTWTPATNATIKRADGTSASWSSIMNSYGTKTVGQSGKDFFTTLFGQEPGH